LIATLVALVSIAALTDLRWRRIPNALVAAGFAAALAWRLYLHRPLVDAWLGAGLALLIYGALFAVRAMGGGDVKLMMAVGAFVGPLPWLLIFAVAAVLGGLAALATLWTRGALLRGFERAATILVDLLRFRAPHRRDPTLDVAHPQARTLPHGVVIAIAVVALAASGLLR
jgi:prepilin peptidase CpaA